MALSEFQEEALFKAELALLKSKTEYFNLKTKLLDEAPYESTNWLWLGGGFVLSSVFLTVVKYLP